MRTKKGTVSSVSGDKTIVVTVETYEAHPIYKKNQRRLKKFHAHDEKNQYKVGDLVTIYETRPMSRLKRWTVSEPVAETKTSPSSKE